MSAVQARVHYAMKQELKLLKEIIAAYTPEEYEYQPTEGSRRAKRSDYDDVYVIPVSDPNASTMAQKIVQYQAVMQLAQQSPQLYNMPLLHRQMLEVLGIKEAQKLVPMEEDQKPTDPVSENQNVLMMKPVKAFMYQDHQAHIMVHMSAMQDPKIMSLLKNNPMAQQLQSAMMAHINEHLGFEYRKQIELQLGMSLPPQKDESGEDINMDQEVEARLAPLLAQASQRLLASNQQQAAQQQAQQQAQDPLLQLQQQELVIKQGDLQRKVAKDQTDAQLKQEQLTIEAQRQKIEAARAMAQMENTKQAHLLDKSVEVLTHLSNTHQSKSSQERGMERQTTQQTKEE
jgi:phage FluMu protein gp41